MKRIILISGKQGSGKSTQCELLTQVLIRHDFIPTVKKFADPLYEMHKVCLPVLKMYKIRPMEMAKDGELLQMLGTEYGRKCIGEDVWVKSCRARVNDWLEINPNNIALIDDCRFENEFDAFPDALRVRLQCPERIRKERCSYWRENTRHPSETGLDGYGYENKFDMTVDTSSRNPIDVAKLIFEMARMFRVKKDGT